jgi:hypothetical protein
MKRAATGGDELLAHLQALRHYEDVTDGKGNVTGRVLAAGAAEAILTALREHGIEVVREVNGRLVCRGKRVPAAVRRFVEEKELQRGLVRYLDIKGRLARQSRGTGAVAPSRPARPTIPSEYESAVGLIETLDRNLSALHHAYAETVDRIVGHFVRLQKKRSWTAEDDPVVAMAEAVKTCERTTSQQHDELVRKIAEWGDITLDGAPADVHRYAEVLNQRIGHLWTSEPFGRGWLVFIEHVLLALAVAFVLRQRAKTIKRGAQVAALIAACRSLRPLLQPVPDDVPVESFGMARDRNRQPFQHPAGEHELREAQQATARAVLTPGKAVGQKGRAGRIAMIGSAAKRLGVSRHTLGQEPAIEVALTGWDHLPLVALYRQALAGRFSHAMDRVSDRAFDAAGKELRETSPSSESDEERLAEKYTKQTGKPSTINGRPTLQFKKFMERQTRYTGRRVGWETIFNSHRREADGSFHAIERDKRGGHHRVKKTEAGDVPSSISKSEQPASPEQELALKELLGIINSKPLLQEFASAALSEKGAKAVADRLGITEEGVKKRKAKLKGLLRQHGYDIPT